jgi:hypothetical protein
MNCATEEATCCNTTGCQALVECVAGNCPNAMISCILQNCQTEYNDAGGFSGAGTAAASDLGTCSQNNCANSCN